MILFVYDELLDTDMQDLIKLDMKFLSYAYVKGKIYYYNDKFRKHTFLIPKDTIKNVYGALYLVDDNYLHRLYAYYNSSYMYSHTVYSSDTYLNTKVKVRMIKFDSIEQFKNIEYKKSEELLEVDCFIGNIKNDKIIHSLERTKYYHINNFDNAFKKLIGFNAK